MSLPRIPLLLVVAGCMHKSLTPPQPSAEDSETDQVAHKNLLERIVLLSMHMPVVNGLNMAKACVWVPALVESAIILAKNGRYPGDWNRLILGHFGGPTRGAFVGGHLSRLVLVGAAVAVAGTSFRTAAYRALGRHFTYELALKKEHTLIKGFPYTVVRHPSYTGWLVTYAGVGLALAAPRDGWLRAVFFPWVTNGPVTSTKVAAVGGAALAFGALSFLLPLIKSRVDVEDEMLHEQFGQEWEDWARRVPYQVVPFVM